MIFLPGGFFSSSVYSSHGAGKVSEQARSESTFLDSYFPGQGKLRPGVRGMAETLEESREKAEEINTAAKQRRKW